MVSKKGKLCPEFLYMPVYHMVYCREHYVQSIAKWDCAVCLPSKSSNFEGGLFHLTLYNFYIIGILVFLIESCGFFGANFG
jgi:hypothetical protein